MQSTWELVHLTLSDEPVTGGACVFQFEMRVCKIQRQEPSSEDAIESKTKETVEHQLCATSVSLYP